MSTTTTERFIPEDLREIVLDALALDVTNAGDQIHHFDRNMGEAIPPIEAAEKLRNAIDDAQILGSAYVAIVEREEYRDQAITALRIVLRDIESRFRDDDIREIPSVRSWLGIYDRVERLIAEVEGHGDGA